MSRLSADKVARKRGPQGRDGIWKAARWMGEFTVPALVAETGIPQKTVADYLKALEAGKYLSSEKKGQAARVYKLVKDTGIETPRVQRDGSPVTQGLCNEQMWRTMKRLKQFSSRDLAINASTDDQQVSEVQAQSYCTWLHKGKYLNVQSRGRKGRPTVYRFVRDTGPKPPQVQRIKQIFDPNTGKVAWSREIGVKA